MLKEGRGQAYRNYPAVNYQFDKVGVGIYFSPHFQVCLGSYTESMEKKQFI